MNALIFGGNATDYHWQCSTINDHDLWLGRTVTCVIMICTILFTHSMVQNEEIQFAYSCREEEHIFKWNSGLLLAGSIAVVLFNDFNTMS